MAQVVVGDLTSPTGRRNFSPFDVESPKSEQRAYYRVELEKGQDGWIIAKCPAVKGAVSQGKDKDEALRNIVEAISLVLEDHGKKEEFLVIWEEK